MAAPLDAAAILEQLLDGVCLSEAGRILYLNPAAERLLGATLERVRGALLCDLLCARLKGPDCRDCAAHCALRDPSSGETAVSFGGDYDASTFAWSHFRVRRQDRQRRLRVRCSISWHGKYFTLIEDASAEAELEAEREEWRSMIVHDLRSPLTSIHAALSELHEAAKERPEDLQTRLLRLGLDGSRRMIELLNLYLDVAALDAGVTRARRETLALDGLARAAAEEQAPLAARKRITVTVDVPAALPARGDAVLTARVLQNLLHNALKFTPEGGRVRLSAAPEPGGYVTVTIQDSGPGIPAEELPRLFDRRHQAQARREGKTRGNGLGLAFCVRALAAMGGEIAAESPPGEGARFAFRLPGDVDGEEAQTEGG